MKYLPLFIVLATFLTLGLLTVMFIEHQTHIDNYNLQEKRLEALRESNAELGKRYELRGDSLRNVSALLAIRKDTIVQADRVTKETIKDHEQIVFIRPASDSVRHRKLSDIFPSYDIPR